MRTQRDKCLYYKEGIKYFVTRKYRIKLDIIPYAPICLSLQTEDVNGNVVHIPIATMDMEGNTVIYPRYAWDGASGPTYDSLNTMIASLIHDLLYQFIRLGLIDPKYKEYADHMLKVIGIEDGMLPCRASYYKLAVDKFGAPSTMPSSERKELVAP